MSRSKNYKIANDEITLSYVRQLDFSLNQKICKMNNIQLADIYLIRSGLLGLYSKKNRSISKGKESYSNLQQAVKIAPKYLKPILVYGRTIKTMVDKNKIAKFFIEKSLGIDLKDERAKAILLLQQFNNKKANELLKKLSKKP